MSNKWYITQHWSVFSFKNRTPQTEINVKTTGYPLENFKLIKYKKNLIIQLVSAIVVVVVVHCCFTSLFGTNGHLSDTVMR